MTPSPWLRAALTTFLLCGVSSASGAPLPGPIFHIEWSGSASAPANFNNPQSIAVSKAGRVYVGHGGLDPRVVVFNETGTFSHTIPFSTYGAYSIGPDDIAVGPDGSVWILDLGGILQRWKNGAHATFLSSDLGGSLPQAVLMGLAMGREYLFLGATDVTGGSATYHDGVGIARLDSTGAVDGVFQTKWHTNECPGAITAVAADIEDNVYIIAEYTLSSTCASGATRLVDLRRYSSTGDKLQRWPLPAGPWSYYGLAVDRAGAIYYSRTGGGVDVIAADTLETAFHYVGGGPTDSLENVRGVALGNSCDLFITDERDRVVRVSLDGDRDGVCNSWERDGLIVRNSEDRFVPEDADILNPDLYVEVDCMDGFAFDTTQALPELVARFAENDIALRVKIDEIELSVVEFTGQGWQQFQDYKQLHFGSPTDTDEEKEAKALVYRYCVFADSLRVRNRDIGGRGEIGGNDFVVALGKQQRESSTGVVPWESQAGVFMHELGHTLNLRHGGRDNILHKPNYISAMNYTWIEPQTATRRFWRLDYSNDSLPPLTEVHLVDSVGIGAVGIPKIPIAGPYQLNEDGKVERRSVAGVGRVDWDGLDEIFGRTEFCDSCDVNTFVGDTRVDDEEFRGFVDWDHLQLAWRDTAETAGFTQDPDPEEPAELTVDAMSLLARSISDCNDNDVEDTDDIATGLSLDANNNWIPDECEPSRVIGLADSIYACPGGDRESLEFAIDFEGVYVFGSGVENHMRIDSVGAGVRAWRDDGRLMAIGDTLREYYRETDDLTNHLTGYFALGRMSGCGYLGFSVWTGDSIVVRDLGAHIISVDQDSLSIGSVDRFDEDLLADAYNQAVPCWNVDGEGTAVTTNDAVELSNHSAPPDHIVRKLLTPNGGGGYAPGSVVPITWQRGYGDSARVTIRLRRESTGDSLTVVADEPDDGAYSWTVPSPVPIALVPDSTYRLQIIHSAGYYKVDNLDVGWDKSDTTFTIRPRKPMALSLSMGRNSAALSWTEAGQAGSNADAYQVADSMQVTITDANFNLAHSVAYSVSPGDSGAAHCVEIDDLTQCKTYSFAVRTRENGIWSLVSVINGNTDCSGFELAICEGGGLLSGGGGGEEGLRSPGLSSMGTGNRRLQEEEVVWNSLLPGGLAEERLDYLALSASPALQDGAYELLLRQTGGRQVHVREFGLGVLDHAPGTVAVSSKDGVLVGTGGNAAGVTGSRIENGSGLASGTGESHRTEAGEIVLVDLGEVDNAALLLEVRGELRAASADSVGILVQRSDGEGGWTTIETVYPRREFAQTAVPTDGHGLLRLVILRDYEVRALRKLSDIAPGQLQPLAALGSVHSRLGEAADSVTLIPGDSLRLRFGQAEPRAATRDYFLTVRGQYRVADDDVQRGTLELTSSPAPILSFSLGAARPNPSSGDVVISYTLARPVRTELRIYDVAGREVRELVGRDEAAGIREAAWDGRDAHGRKVPSGVYFYRLRAGDWQSERKLIVLQK